MKKRKADQNLDQLVIGHRKNKNIKKDGQMADDQMEGVDFSYFDEFINKSPRNLEDDLRGNLGFDLPELDLSGADSAGVASEKNSQEKKVMTKNTTKSRAQVRYSSILPNSLSLTDSALGGAKTPENSLGNKREGESGVASLAPVKSRLDQLGPIELVMEQLTLTQLGSAQTAQPAQSSQQGQTAQRQSTPTQLRSAQSSDSLISSEEVGAVPSTSVKTSSLHVARLFDDKSETKSE